MAFHTTAGNDDDYIYDDLDTLPGWENNESSDYFSCTSSEVSESKESKSKTSPSSSKKRKRILKYNNNSTPINPNITSTLENSLREWEEKLHEKGSYCVWENFASLTDNQAKALCIQAWNVQVHEVSEIEMNDGMTTDCGIGLFFGPSAPKHIRKYYIGNFYYFKSTAVFFPDLVRCNCAVLKKVKGVIKTESNSKKYFFLYKYSDTMYYVLTLHGRTLERKLKVVNVQEIHLGSNGDEPPTP